VPRVVMVEVEKKEKERKREKKKQPPHCKPPVNPGVASGNGTPAGLLHNRCPAAVAASRPTRSPFPFLYFQGVFS
jgi:hypothetical protein